MQKLIKNLNNYFIKKFIILSPRQKNSISSFQIGKRRGVVLSSSSSYPPLKYTYNIHTMEIPTKDESLHKDTQKCMSNNMISNCLIVLPLTVPQFIHNSVVSHSSSVSKQPNFTIKNLKIQSLVSETTAHVVNCLQSSIVSTADKCSKFFELIASQNPFFGKVVSLSNGFQDFCQVPSS